jgi:outer membrane protein assembly factor BamB
MRAHLKNKLQGLAGASRLRTRTAFFCALVFVGAACALVARGEHTRHWRTSSYEEFLKGTAHGVAVRSDGRIELAPKFTLLADADASYLWSLRSDPKGVLYTSGGSPAKVFRFDAAGKPLTVFESSDLSAQAIAFDAQGNLFVGTSPDGKVYRVSASGEKSVFFDPKTKYIWDLAFSPDGTLYVATGDKGQIFAVNSSGEGELFYSSDEAHIRVLAFDGTGNLIAGTEPSGRVLRVARADAKNGSSEKPASDGIHGFVLYETPKREVTALAVAADGTIYASAIGERQHNVAPPPSMIVNPQGNTTITSTSGAVISSSQAASPSVFVAFPPLLSSSIYRISPTGAADELWTSREDVVYGLGLAADGRLLAGTGNNGALLAIDSRGVFAQLAKAGSAQITGISRGKDGRVFVCTANPGKIFSVGPEFEAEGSYESRSFDAQIFSQWGRMEWFSPRDSEAGANSRTASLEKKFSPHDGEPRVEFFARSGNTEDPGKEWSPWAGPYSRSGAAVDIPAARFAQWKAVIHGGRPGDGVDWASLAYQPRNVAPVIEGIALQDPGVRASATTILSTGQPASVSLKLPTAPTGSGVIITQSGTPPRFEPPPQGVLQKGYASVLWTAHDDNDDDLRYAVYYRGENEREWKLLKDKLEQKFYSWDTTSFADGAYYLKIVASDALSNPPAVALTAERISERFEVDNTSPSIENLEATTTVTRGGSPAIASVITKFTARDAGTSVERAQYSVDGGDWVLVAPIGKISDAPEEKYEFTLGALLPGEHTVAVRAYDRFENVGSAKTTVTLAGTPAAK